MILPRRYLKVRFDRFLHPPRRCAPLPVGERGSEGSERPGIRGDHGACVARSAGRSGCRGGRAETVGRGDQARRGTPPQVLLIVFGCWKCCWEFCWEFETFKLSPKLSNFHPTFTQTFTQNFHPDLIDRFGILLIVLGFH